jgi:hypothetical protein
MARNEHKKDLKQLTEAYQNVQEGLFNYRVQEDDGSWPIDEREAERRKNPDYGEPEEDGGYMGEDEDAEDTFKVGDWVYDDEGAHASIVDIDGDEVALYDGKEGWTTHISEIKPEEYDEGLYPKSLGSGGSITSSQKFLGDEQSEDDEGWGRVAKGALLSSLLGKGAITGGLAGAAYHALKGKTPKKKEDKEDKGFTKGGW